jgi:SAM-dependent methyltransferase
VSVAGKDTSDTIADGGFARIAKRIGERSPLQRRKLEAYLASRDSRFHHEADQFAHRYGAYLHSQGLSLDDAVDAYLKLCADMMRCQVAFMRSGRYPTADAASAAQQTYLQPAQMLPYMIGLAMSQFLWETHREIFDFFRSAIRERRGAVASYLEIGPGHGLLFDCAAAELDPATRLTAIDISPTSMQITRSIIEQFWPGRAGIDFRVADITDARIDERFDFIAMGEVLEHVDAPGALLRRLGELLATNGSAFISTCANCPAIDHVHEFHDVDEIRALIGESGLHITRERILPVEKLPMREIVERRITVNYCALVTHAQAI